MQKQSNSLSFMTSVKPVSIFNSTVKNKSVWRSMMAMTLGVGLATLSGCNDKPAPETDSNPATTKEAKTVAITQIV